MKSRIRYSYFALVALALALLPALAQKKNAAPPSEAAAEQPTGTATKGKVVYSRHCGICHYPTTTQKKVGPGLKEIYKRGKFADGKKVDDASMRKWIEEGGKQMPPYKNLVSRQEMADLIAYLKTL